MSEIDKIRERIRKLLALADNNPSPEEAALAASKASELALEYGLEIDRIREERGEAPLPPTMFYIDDEEHDKPHQWIGALSMAICEANGCRFIFLRVGSSSKKIDHVRLGGAGRKEAQDIVRLTYAYITESMRRTQRQYVMKQALGSPKLRAQARKAYRIGYSQVVAKRIRAWADSLNAQQSKNALVLYRGDQLTVVDAFIKKHLGETEEVNTTTSIPDRNAYLAGQQDGNEVSVNRQMESTKTPAREMLQ